MSAGRNAQAEHGAHGNGPGHGDGAAHGTMRDYVAGFLLSVVLTATPFWLVMARPLADTGLTGALVAILAGAQIVVHMIFFLHMNTRSEGGWNMLALLFTVVLVVIVLSGSLWVMHHLNANMMPMGHDMAEMP